ncbi:hypothetical protein ACGVWS_04310 [Enterobacteriaceae bacterium LUAb1]
MTINRQGSDTRRSTDNTLPAPVVIASADGGIGYNDVIQDPEKKNIIAAGPIISSLEGDTITLYWGTYPHAVARRIVEANDTGIYALTVDAQDIVEAGEGTHEVYYVLHTFIGDEDIISEKTTVEVKFSIPGGLDSHPETPYINERLAAPVVSPKFIDFMTLEVSATISPWENMTVGDILTLSWNGIIVEQPPLAAHQLHLPVKIVIANDILQAGGDGEEVHITYSIRDKVNNWSKWSPSTSVSVDIGGSDTLAEPIVPSAPDGKVILEELGKNDLSVLVLSYDGIAKNDTVTLICHGLTNLGQATNWAGSIVVDDPGSFIRFLVPNEEIRNIAGGTATLSYHVINAAGSSIRKSRRTPLSIIGHPKLFNAPFVEEAHGAFLNPNDVLDSVHAQVRPYAEMKTGDVVTLFWVGTTAVGQKTLWNKEQTVTTQTVGQSLIYLIPEEEVTRLDMGSVEIYYSVTTYPAAFAIQTIIESEILRLKVRDPVIDLELPEPIVDFVSDGVLDASKAERGTTVHINYPNMQRGDHITLIWQSKESLIDSVPVNREGEVNFTVFPNYITQNLNEEVIVLYKVQRKDGGLLSSKAVTFRIRASVFQGISIAGARGQSAPFYYANPVRLYTREGADGGEIQWQYAGQEDIAVGQSFLDTYPEFPLNVSLIKDNQVVHTSTLRAGNVTGLFSFDKWDSGCLIKDDGSLYSWGEDIIQPPSTLGNVKHLAVTGKAYAALHHDGTVTAWGDAHSGGVIPAALVSKLTDVTSVVGTQSAFAALHRDGTVTTWGDALNGGEIPSSMQENIKDIIQINSSASGFAVTTRFGGVLFWGGPEWTYGMHAVVPPYSVQQVSATNGAFAVLMSDGNVVAFGNEESGGKIPDDIADKLKNVKSLAATSNAFAAITHDNKVFTWGDSQFGGALPTPIDNAVHILGSTTAFAALLLTGEVMAWGEPAEGGRVPDGVKAVSLVAGYRAFAALQPNGNVISWGRHTGSYTAGDAVAVYAAGSNFIIFTKENKLVSWGKHNLELSSLNGLISRTIINE